MNKKTIYFNNAETSWPKPNTVAKEVIDSVNKSLNNAHKSSQFLPDEGSNYLQETKKLLCRFFNSKKSDNFYFTSSSTAALSLLLRLFVAKHKKKIHIIATELEHNAVLKPLNALLKEKKISLSFAKFDEKGYVSLDSIKNEIRKDTKLVVVNHGSNVLGTVQDIRTIGRYLKEGGIDFIVDAAQTAGNLRINIPRLDVAALAFSGHKAMFGYYGVGGFHIKDNSILRNLTKREKCCSEQINNSQTIWLRKSKIRLEHPNVLSLYHGVRFIEKTGLEKIRQKTSLMSKYIISELLKEPLVRIYNKNPDLPIIPFNIERINPKKLALILEKEHNIITKAGIHCAPLVHKRINNNNGCVRISLSYFNTINECEKTVQKIGHVINSCQS